MGGYASLFSSKSETINYQKGQIRATPQTEKPMAPAYELVTKRYKIAGTITIDEPATGIKDAKADTTPQRMGLGMPKIANPKAVKNPFVKAIISELDY